ncbi:MAG TPA: Ig-like domain-containing protein [Pyrinomonadaceae bacterium]|nr:Ig-like domain-containing protein [Pyrinomonadaceae bacterium]
MPHLIKIALCLCVVVFTLLEATRLQLAAPQSYDTGTGDYGPAAALSLNPAQPAQNGRIAFLSARNGNGDIYSVNPDGTGERRLTTHGASDIQPFYSLDGRLVSFTTNRHGSSDIYVVNADGTNERRVTSSPATESDSALSPDATRLVFSRRTGITDNLYTINLDGTGEQQLTFNSGFDIALNDPSYSRDGSLIAFSKRVNSSPNLDIYVINADGTGERQVTSHSSAEFYPNFLPDGRIVFADNRNNVVDLYVVNVDGTGEQRVTNGVASNTEPTVSPDGTRVAFRTSRNSVSGVYTLGLDGTNLQFVGGGGSQPSWGGAEAAPTPTPTPPNTPPVANGVALSTAEDAARAFTLSASDAEGDALTYTVVSAPAHGTLTGALPALVYTPALNYNGPDSFTFKVNDGEADSNVATVSLNVTPVNDAPVATDDVYSVVGDLSLSVATPGVLANDADVEGGALTAAIASGPAHGTLALNADGSFTYTPAAGYAGPDSFTYRASEGPLQSAPATVTLDVNAPVCSSPPSDQIAWYPGNGNGQDLVAGKNVTPKNGADWAAGKVAQAFRFDNPGNSNEVFYTTGPSISEPYEQLTIRAWVYPTQHGRTSNGFGKTVISRTNGDGFALRLYNGQIEADLRLSSGTGTGPLNIFTGTVVPLNRWSHVAITYDGAQIKAYLDGRLIGAQDATGRIRNWENRTACTMIGNEPNPPCSIQGDGGFGWNGLIDEVEVFSRALSAAEIQGGYHASSAGTCTSPASATAVQPATAAYSPADQAVTLQASVTSPAGAVNAGSVQFTVTTAADDLVGMPVNAPVTNGTAAAVYTLPGGTPPQALTVSASYGSPASEFQGSQGEAALTITKAAPTVSVDGGTFTYDGRPHPAEGTVTGAGGQSLGTPTFTYTPGGADAPVAVGTYQVLASFDGDANHEPASDTATIIINKATSTVTVTADDATYDGQPHGATAVANGAGGLDQTLAVTYAGRNGTNYPPSQTPPTNAGFYTASASFGGDANHDGDDASADFTISKATAVISVTPYNVTFDGQPHTSTGTATGVNNTPLAGLDLTGTTHTGARTYDDIWTFNDPTGNYDDATGTVTNTIAKATSAVTVTCPPGVTYTGEAQTPCTANVTGAGGLNESVSVTYQNNVNAGQASAGATYAGGPNHLGGTGNAAFIINKAASITVVTFEPGPYVYRGSAFTARALVTGAGGLDASVSVGYTGDCTNVTNADGCTATATYQGDANHDGSSDAKSITITKASATIALADLIQTYDGTPRAATVTSSPSGLSGLLVTYDGSVNAPTNAGSYTVLAVLDNQNYQAAQASGTLVINRAAASISVSVPAGPVAYDAQPHPATGFAYGVGGTSDVLAPAVTFTYNGSAGAPVNAATYAVVATFAGNANYLPAADSSSSITIKKATPAVHWADPADITYGTPLGASQLNAAADVPGVFNNVAGTFTYTPAAGDVLGAGAHTLRVEFIPADAANFNGASKDVTLNVTQAALSVRADDKAKTYGDPAVPFTVGYAGFVNGDDEGDLQGSLAFNFADSPTTPAGSYTITPSGLSSQNYAVSFVDGTLTVSTAALTVKADDKSKTYGDPAVTFTASYAGLVNDEQPSSLAGTLVFDFADTNATSAGSYTVTPSGLSSPNYSIQYVAGTFTVAKADQTVVWDDPAGVVYGTQLSAAQLNATVTVVGPSASGSVSYSPAAGHVPNAGDDQPLTVNVAGTDNYNPASKTVHIDVAKATPVIDWDTPAAITLGVALSGAQLNATAAHPTVSGPLSGTAVPGAFAYNPAAGAVLPVGNNTLSVLFTPGDTANYNTAAKSVVQRVNYLVSVLFDQTQAHQSGSTITIRLQLSDASGGDQSSSGIKVTAIGVRKISDVSWGTPTAPGNSNPDLNFSYHNGGYTFNLKTTGYTTGTYELGFVIGNDPTVYTLQFQIE